MDMIDHVRALVPKRLLRVGPEYQRTFFAAIIGDSNAIASPFTTDVHLGLVVHVPECKQGFVARLSAIARV